MSMVSDHYGRMPQWPWNPAPKPYVPPSDLKPSAAEVAELRQLIEDFKEAIRAAKTVDELTGQPDCVDPEKATLEDRVSALEALLADNEWIQHPRFINGG